MNERVVVLDNGGGTIKAGFAGDPNPVKVFPNCTAKIKGERHNLVGDMLLDTKEILSLVLRRPFDRGYPVNFELQREIWARTFKHVLRINPREYGLVLTEPLFNLPSIQAEIEQIIFDDFGFRSVLILPAAELSITKDAELRPSLPTSRARTGVVIDAGFSLTTVVPVFDGKAIPRAARRIDFGGKAMTNYFKELVSYRSLHLMDEIYLVESIKDSMCFVSGNPRHDLVLAKQKLWTSPHRREFVLPDGVNNLRGYIRDKPVAQKIDSASEKPHLGPQIKEQVLVVNNERFMVPEVLFNPSDIGIEQAGLAETIVQAVNASNPVLHSILFSNIVLTGGVCQCPGFKERLVADLRPLVPDDYELGVHLPEAPLTHAWQGGSLVGISKEYGRYAITRAQYMEDRGSRRWNDK
ncbi:hypothetical protein BSKO_07680 [Bryopsis sp. KO-2023]|nr:hypothetical protein BSKO_07680 [Bryopsis sp. KO-2023]